MGKIVWTAEAETWLREIHDYIAADNPAAAQRTVRGIYDRAKVLGRFPEVGYLYSEGSHGVIRVLLYGHYRIAYLVEGKREIQILGIFHGSLDMDRYLI